MEDGELESRSNGQLTAQPRSTGASTTVSQSSTAPSQDSFQVTAPSITLPKGGGAIRRIGEKFGANPVTGTGSMSMPIATSPGRSGFGSQLSLSYDSGAGNDPFGFGWSLAVPSITRKTDESLPKYDDATESDVFVLSGAEDLVPMLVEVAGHWTREVLPPRTIDGHVVRIHRYRPRIEGLFARIERWTRETDGDVHWRSISKDNILTLYGKESTSRIANPGDPLRVFTWLMCETRDDKGNAVLYDSTSEDGVGVDLTSAHERNRGDRNDPRRAANRYLKRIRYGNRVPLLDNAGQRPRALTQAQIVNAGWMVEAVFDYGEHDTDTPLPQEPGKPRPVRNDPFSIYRVGLEVRTYRLCQRMMMFHHFEGEEGVGQDCLVRSPILPTRTSKIPPTLETLSTPSCVPSCRPAMSATTAAISRVACRRSSSNTLSRLCRTRCRMWIPPVWRICRSEWTVPPISGPICTARASPVSSPNKRGAWFYQRNVSSISHRPVEFAPLERGAVKPNLALAGWAQFIDLAGDGQPDVVMLDGSMPGLYEHDEEEGWQPFHPFTSRLNRLLAGGVLQ